MKSGPLVLRRFFGHAEHFARAGEIKPAVRGESFQGRQQEMGAVDVGVQGGELVVEGVADEALGRQVVALVGLHLVDHPVDAGIALLAKGFHAIMVLSKIAWSCGIMRIEKPCGWCAGCSCYPGESRENLKGRSFPWAAFWFSSVAFWNDRIKLRPWVASRALKNDPVPHEISVTICPWAGVLHRCHGGDLEYHCGRVHGAGNLLDYIVNGVSVTDNAAFVNMAANKNNLGHHRRIARGSLLVDGVELHIREGSDCDEPYPVCFLEFFEIGAN